MKLSSVPVISCGCPEQTGMGRGVMRRTIDAWVISPLSHRVHSIESQPQVRRLSVFETPMADVKSLRMIWFYPG